MKRKKQIIENRPFIKMAIHKGDLYEVKRINQTTKEMFSIMIEGEIYLAFIKAQRDINILNNARLDKVIVNFLAKNLIEGEIRN